jgi:hypothetical protein
MHVSSSQVNPCLRPGENHLVALDWGKTATAFPRFILFERPSGNGLRELLGQSAAWLAILAIIGCPAIGHIQLSTQIFCRSFPFRRAHGLIRSTIFCRQDII